MERVTLRIPERQVRELEELAERGEFPNRSEAIRTAVRDMLTKQRQLEGKRPMALGTVAGRGD